MGNRLLLPRLHVITDEVLQTRYTHQELTTICVNAGADGVQFREKRNKTFDQRVAIGRALQTICETFGSTLIVNDHVDVAQRLHARGVHLGRMDESIALAREKLGDQGLIGGTANSLAEATHVDTLPVDYIGVGPVFGTTSKNSAAPRLGLENLGLICDAVQNPVIAIGNIQPYNVEEVLSVGAHGVAVLSAVVCAPNVERTTREFCNRLGV